MTDAQEAALRELVSSVLERLKVTERACALALENNRALQAAQWDLWRELVGHDHCDLCGQMTLGTDHACK